MIKYANVFDMCFISRVLHNVNFMTILCSFLTPTVCHPTLKKSCKSRALHSTCTQCHQNLHCLICTCTKTNKPEENLKIFVNGRRPDSTLGKRKIVIGMLIASMMNKKIVRHFQACESKRKAMNRNWSNQKANPALKTKAGNK